MATNEGSEDRWQTPRRIWRDVQFVYQVLGGLLLVGIGAWIGARLFGGDPGYATNLYTEVLSISVTVFVLDLLARRREERREEARLKADLIMRMGSRVNDTAVSAADELRARGWLYDGSLNKTNLDRANLEGADLDGANLQEAGLYQANLQEAGLESANLQEAYLREANLQGADLWNVNLGRATLSWANLERATLSWANLQGIDLWGAKLEGADLTGVGFDEDTLLPDGTGWTPDTDMTRFTDPAHSDFWRPEPGSVWWYPAEGGQDDDE